jgi:hypothetical protein
MLMLMLMLVPMLLQAAGRCFKKLKGARKHFEAEERSLVAFKARMEASNLAACWPEEVEQELVVAALPLCKVSSGRGCAWVAEDLLLKP